MKVNAQQDIDRNHKTVSTNESFKVSKTISFSGAAGSGAVGTVNVFTVTGRCLVTVFGVCTESLVGATATVALGMVGNTTALIATTTATDVDAGYSWVDATPFVGENLPAARVVPNGNDIIVTVGTADVTDGTIDFYCLWRPLSSDGLVEAA